MLSGADFAFWFFYRFNSYQLNNCSATIRDDDFFASQSLLNQLGKVGLRLMDGRDNPYNIAKLLS